MPDGFDEMMEGLPRDSRDRRWSEMSSQPPTPADRGPVMTGERTRSALLLFRRLQLGRSQPLAHMRAGFALAGFAEKGFADGAGWKHPGFLSQALRFFGKTFFKGQVCLIRRHCMMRPLSMPLFPMLLFPAS